jgi:hypothetical protein
MLYRTSVESVTVVQHGRFGFLRNIGNMIAEKGEFPIIAGIVCSQCFAW